MRTEIDHLILALNAGDEARFCELFRLVAPRLKGDFVRRGMRGEAAEELAQEVMLLIWRRASQFDPHRGSGWAWVFTISRNVQIDDFRKRQRPASEFAEPEPAPAATPEQVLLAKERSDQLVRAVGELPEAQIQVLRRALVQESSLSLTAQKLAMPLGTAKSHFRRALKRLRVVLAEPAPT